MSSDTVVANVEEVTQLSADTNTIAVKINLLNFARYAPVRILPVCGGHARADVLNSKWAATWPK